MTAHKQFKRFLTTIPWTAVALGAALGAFGTLAAQAGLSGGVRVSAALQFALGVLCGGVVGWVIPESVNALRTSWRASQPLRKVLTPFHKESSPVTIFLAAMFPTDTSVFEKAVPLELRKTDQVVPHHGVPWILTESDTWAFGYTMALLAQAGKTANITVVRDDSGINIAETNIILIGSPKSNFKTRQLNASFTHLPLRFQAIHGRQVIVTEDAQRRWEADELIDYAVLAKIANEHDPGKAVLLLAGISYVGTAGAGYYLWKRWREIEALAGPRYFALVLRIRRDDYQHVERAWEYVAPYGVQ